MYMAKQDDVDRAKKIILDILDKRITLDSIELNELAEKLLNISYSLGGRYDEGTIRQIADVKIKEWFKL